MYSPNLCYQVINIIPGDRAIGNPSPPPHAIRRQNISMRVEMVGDGNLVIFPWGSDESYPEGLARRVGQGRLRLRARKWGG